MKILYIVTKSERGGPTTHIFQLSKYLISKGHQIALMSYPGGWKKKGWLEEELQKMGGKFYPNRFFSNSIFNPFKDLLTIILIRKAVRNFKPDLVSCHSSKAGFLGRLAVRNKVPTLFTAHGWGFAKGSSDWRKILIPLEKLSARFCRKIICVSESDRKLALRYGIAPEKKFLVIHNGTEIDYDFNISYEKYGENIFKIVFVGRLAVPKDQILLLKAFLSLDKELREMSRIILIGDGPNRGMLEKFVNDNNLSEYVEFKGSLPREEIFEILKNCHIFALISNWEGFPRTIVEAMSYGLPVIASDVGGAREAVDKNTGFMVQRGDRMAIRDVLKKLIKDPLLAYRMGKNGREKVIKEFSVEKMIGETCKVYLDILNSEE